MSLPLVSIMFFKQIIQQLPTWFANQQTPLVEDSGSYKRLRNWAISLENPKKHKPEKYNGKESVTNRTTDMNKYFKEASYSHSLHSAVSYFTGAAYELQMVSKEWNVGWLEQTWPDLRHLLVFSLDIFNKGKVARDKLACWHQIEDVSMFNDDF